MRYTAILVVLQIWGMDLALSTVSPTITSVDPTVNTGDLIIVENSTGTEVTTFLDSSFVYLRYNASGFGIIISDLRACDQSDCGSFNIQLIDENGCPKVHAGVGTIIPSGFVRNTVDSRLYETASFQMFKWENGNQMFLKGKKSVCEANTAECDDKCAAFSGRRRRAADPVSGDRPRSGTFLVLGVDGKPCNISFSNDDRNVDLTDTDKEKGDVAESSGETTEPLNRWHRLGQIIHRPMSYLFRSDHTFYPGCREGGGSSAISVSVLGLLSALSTLLAVTLTYKVQTLQRRRTDASQEKA